MFPNYSTIDALDALAEKAVSELFGDLEGLIPPDIQERLLERVKTDMLSPEQRVYFYLRVGDVYSRKRQYDAANAAYGLVTKAAYLPEEFSKELLCEIAAKRFLPQGEHETAADYLRRGGETKLAEFVEENFLDKKG